MRLQRIEHEFVEFIPQDIQAGKLYISIDYATATHLCCCGCGFEVSTPLSPSDWVLVFNGEAVSLSSSIGNSSFPCRSHYWITEGRVVWEGKMTNQLAAASRARDKEAKLRKYGPPEVAVSSSRSSRTVRSEGQARESWLSRLLKSLS